MSVNTDTGEIQTLDQVNTMIDDLIENLRKIDRALTKLLDDHRLVADEYSARLNASIASSELGSADRRKAEAETLMRKVTLRGDDMSIAARKSLLEMQIRIKRETGHNIRAALSGLQTKSSNIREEMRLAGYGGRL